MEESSVILEDGQSKTVLMSSDARESRIVQTVFIHHKTDDSTIVEFD